VVQAPSAPIPLDPEVQCRSCGAAYEPGQDYCLECGGRIFKPRGAVYALGRGWRRRLGWYPGDWVWGSLLAFALAAGGAVAAIQLDRRTNSPVAQEAVIVATSRLPRAPPPKASLPARPSPRPRATRSHAAPPPAAARHALTEWPKTRGYTVVLSSLPVNAGRAAARAKASEALKARLPQVGILVSSRYASLHPGYYVVFSGIYSSLEEAQSAISRASSKFPSAYARDISP
jgi:hypothetical protein